MNCPHHHRIFAAEPHSYRDLPLRLAEYGTCYRYEQSGELFGLMRVRSLNMNDAHIYCTEEQFADEFRAVNDMYLKYFKIFGLEKYQMRFSTHAAEGLGKKYVNEPELWKKTEDMVRKVLIESGINYVEVANEAAFYGPKIDVQVWSAIGREFTIATNQVDFAVPAKFGLTYRDKDNSNKTPLCIHRAPLGTHERFIGFLIEHYAGNFPLWLAPDQVRVITLNDDEALINYAKPIVAELRANMVRVDADFSATPFKAKISNAEQLRVHTMLVIGGRDMESGAVSVRLHHGGPQGAKPKAEVGWRESLNIGEMVHGAFGENFTVQGMLEADVCVGDVFQIGPARVEVSQPRQPCWKLARRWRIKDLTAQVEQTGRTGFYFRVLHHGWVQAGDRFELVERSFPQFTIAHANNVMHHWKEDFTAARELASCPKLSASWKDSLWLRAENHKAADTLNRINHR